MVQGGSVHEHRPRAPLQPGAGEDPAGGAEPAEPPHRGGDRLHHHQAAVGAARPQRREHHLLRALLERYLHPNSKSNVAGSSYETINFQKFPNHKTLEGPDTTEMVLENLYPNTIYHIWVAAKSRRGEGAATPELAVRTEQYGKSPAVTWRQTVVNFYSWQE